MQLSHEHIAFAAGQSFAAFCRLEDCFGFEWHRHDEVELTIITKGQGVVVLGETFAPYAAGDGFLVGSGLPHTWASEGAGPHEALVVQLPATLLTQLAATMVEARPLATLQQRALRGLRFPCQAIEADLRAIVTASPLHRLPLLMSALVEVAQAGSFEVLPAPWQDRHQANERLDAFLQWLEAHADQSVALADAASALSMSAGGLSQFLRRETKKSFTDHVQHLRLSRAAVALTSGKKRVLDIAFAVGFGSLAQFNKSFRAYFGCSPSEFRRSHHAR